MTVSYLESVFTDAWLKTPIDACPDRLFRCSTGMTGMTRHTAKNINESGNIASVFRRGTRMSK
jgi:hypothetical protein